MLQVMPFWLANPLRNFNYLVWDTQSREAAAIDPLEVPLLLKTLQEQKLTLKYIINTHEHWDHTAGNRELVQVTQALVLAADLLKDTIPFFGKALLARETIVLGKEKLLVLPTPGHTLGHISLYYEAEPPLLFCGDTLFSAGVGNCYHGGDVALLFETFEKVIFQLPRETVVYPGHDYWERNLRFALSLLPQDEAIRADLLLVTRPGSKFRSLADEFRSNLFFRLDDTNLRKALVAKGYAANSAREVFYSLRQLRDKW